MTAAGAAGAGAPRTVLVHPDADTLAEATAARLITRLVDLQSAAAPVHVVLTGGTVGIKTLAAVAGSPARAAVDWSGVHLWWGDERFLTDGDVQGTKILKLPLERAENTLLGWLFK